MNELQQDTARAIVNIFETGRILGDYSAIAVAKGDSGHLSYGRSQAALGSGILYTLLQTYCEQSSAQFATQLMPYLPRLQRKDFSLDNDVQLKMLLKQAGKDDPVMRATQDEFFNRHYFSPACAAAEAIGIGEPLGQTVIYDSFIQGGWGLLKSRIGAPVQGNAQDWVKRYVALRTSWLKSLKPPLPSTTYRMASFNSLIQANNWDLALPITVHGVTITEVALADPAASPSKPPRLLQLTTPYLRGPDVKAVQTVLYGQMKLTLAPDGIYGPFTAKLVAERQSSQHIEEDGVGEKTRKALGL